MPCCALQVLGMYSWHDVARRTEAVYAHAVQQPHSSALRARLPRLLACGPVFGLLAAAFAAVDLLWLAAVRLLDPKCDIELAPRLRPPLPPPVRS